MTTAAVKIRIPYSWYGRVHSAEVRGWMQSWFQNPYALPIDPGAGEARISLALPSRAVKRYLRFPNGTGARTSIALTSIHDECPQARVIL
jgi:hypothetical protein